METASDLVSPKQVARAIGVSESSLKRWCDQGLIKTVRTAGGHRKMQVGEVLRFVRERNLPLVAPELLDLPASAERSELGMSRSLPRVVEALLTGNEAAVRQIVFDLYLAKHPISLIFDQVLAAAFREIGERWACHEADLYQERRGCEICLRVLFDLRRVQRITDPALSAIGGTMEGDLYTLPSAMVELVLRESGWNATSLGTSIPFPSLIKAVEQIKPRLFWLSVSHIPPSLDFVKELTGLSRACQQAGAAMIVGGRVLTDEIRQRVTDVMYCDTMQQLGGFAQMMARSTLRQEST